MNHTDFSQKNNVSDAEKLSRTELIVTVFTFLGIWSFLLHYFQPELLFSDTTAAGGDTGGHNLLAWHLRDYLLPKGRLIGWYPWSFCGLPLFQFYFPLPYFIMAILSYVIPFNIAFKLTTVLGIFFLPAAGYLSMRAMKFRFPMPLISAVMCLLYLFKESGIAAGGTIKSALAGQFAYTLSVAFMILALGLVYKGIENRGHVISAGAAIAGVVFSHAFGLIPLMIACTFFVFEDIRYRRLSNTIHLAKVFGLGFFLSGVWSVPYLFKRGLGMIVFDFAGLSSSFGFLQEYIFWVPLSVSVAGIAVSLILKQPVKHQLFVLYWFAGIILFSYVTKSSLLLSRFTNVMFLFALFAAVSALAGVRKWLQGTCLLPIIAALVVFSFLKHETKEIGSWIKWNYEGVEKKLDYPQFRDLNAFFKDADFSGRINFEYYNYNALGSPRIFEMSPMFHHKPVMEGLLFESSITYPFFFYMQHEVSESCWWPGFPIRMPKQNMANGVQDFRLFNVHYFVAKTQKTKQLADDAAGLVKVRDVGDMRIYRVEPAGQYVEALSHEPILIKTGNWRPYSYTWMGADRRNVMLAFTNPEDTESDKYFQAVYDEQLSDGVRTIKKDLGAVTDERMNQILAMGKDYDSQNCEVTEQIESDRIVFKTTCPGRPHLVKISYFPNWKVKGASRVYHASPSLMMVIPESDTVELYYGWLPEDVIGFAATVISIMGILFFLMFPNSRFAAGFQKQWAVSELRINRSLENAGNFFRNPKRLKQTGIILIIFLAVICTAYLIAGFALKQRACQRFCKSLKENAVVIHQRILKRIDAAKLGFSHTESRNNHNFVCDGASCDESRKEFVYVNSGAVHFDLKGKKGSDHILTVYTQDNVNCRSNTVSADGVYLGKMIGKGLQTRERRFFFRVPAALTDDNQIRVTIAKDNDDCFGFDIFRVELAQVRCDCDS